MKTGLLHENEPFFLAVLHRTVLRSNCSIHIQHLLMSNQQNIQKITLNLQNNPLLISTKTHLIIFPIKIISKKYFNYKNSIVWVSSIKQISKKSLTKKLKLKSHWPIDQTHSNKKSTSNKKIENFCLIFWVLQHKTIFNYIQFTHSRPSRPQSSYTQKNVNKFIYYIKFSSIFYNMLDR